MSEKDTYFITTPIYYVNDVPHIGHAYTSLACDVVARFMRMTGKEVKFLTGTDEHGQKVEKSAEKAGKSPKEFVDETAKSFQSLNQYMKYSNDDFIRTTDDRHKRAAQLFWVQLQESGDIYLEKYAGWYSVRDEAFYTESELAEDGKAPTGAPVEWVEEPSYFFALSKYQDKLLEFYEANPDFIKPESRRNEVISFVKGGLHDLSVSRTSFKWGIEVPGDEEHIMYVWLDALTNYISALGYGVNIGKEYTQFWPANAHVVGKDILRFHAVYWPAFLMSAGLPLPKQIIAHGWWTNEGEKISKSLGNVIDPKKLVEEFGLDRVRYFLMREVPFGNDGNFSREQLVARCNSELSNKIGNLMQRTCSFAYKSCDRVVPEVSDDFINEMYESEYMQKILAIVQGMPARMATFELNQALGDIVHIAEEANHFIDMAAPWELKKTDEKRMRKVLFQLMETVRYIAVLLRPFIPDSSTEMLNQLVIAEKERGLDALNREHVLKPGSTMQEPKPVFPRI